MFCSFTWMCTLPVSYTHLDVYKRQGVYSPLLQAEHLPALDGEGERYSPTKPGDDPTAVSYTHLRLRPEMFTSLPDR